MGRVAPIVVNNILILLPANNLGL